MMTKLDVNTQIQQQAAEFVARLYSGELSAKEEETIRAWCAADNRHQQEFDNMIRVWDASQELYETIDHTPQVRKYKVVASIAASVIVAIAAGLFITWPKIQGAPGLSPMVQTVAPQALKLPERQIHDYQTQVGEVKDVTLPDGTLVTLNTNTAITFDFSGDTRKLELKHGEAFFAVAKDPSKVFVIDTGQQFIRVIGTKFNVRKNANSLQIAVKEGLVAVHDSADISHPQFDHDAGDTLLPAGTIGSFSKDGKIVSTAQTDKVERLAKLALRYISF